MAESSEARLWVSDYYCCGHMIVVVLVGGSVGKACVGEGRARQPITIKADRRRMPSRGKRGAHWWYRSWSTVVYSSPP